VTTNSEAENLTPMSPPISRLNRSHRELILAAHRERGLQLRAMIAGAARKVSLWFANRRTQQESRPAATTRPGGA
jgi:hypothetical protein